MAEAVHIAAIEQVLSAIYASGDTPLSSFIIHKPNAPAWDRLSGLGTEIFARRKEYIRALLFIRQNGAPYVRDGPVVARYVVPHRKLLVHPRRRASTAARLLIRRSN